MNMNTEYLTSFLVDYNNNWCLY